MPRVYRAGLIALLALLPACSSTFMYNQLDWLIPWYADDYVDINREQTKSFKARLIPLLEWHRKDELPTYLPIVDGITADLDAPITEAVISGWMGELELAYKRLEANWLPMLLDLGDELSDAQVEELMDNLREEQEELQEEYLERSEEDYVEDSYDNMADNLSDLLGRLSAEQKQVLQDAAKNMQRFDSGWLQERQQWLDKMAVILQRNPGWQQAMKDAIADQEVNRDPTYTEAYEINQSIIFRAMAEVLNSRSEKQDSRLRREISDLRADIVTLINQGQ
jgi:hypothetical protein